MAAWIALERVTLVEHHLFCNVREREVEDDCRKGARNTHLAFWGMVVWIVATTTKATFKEREERDERKCEGMGDDPSPGITAVRRICIMGGLRPLFSNLDILKLLHYH